MIKRSLGDSWITNKNNLRLLKKRKKEITWNIIQDFLFKSEFTYEELIKIIKQNHGDLYIDGMMIKDFLNKLVQDGYFKLTNNKYIRIKNYETIIYFDKSPVLVIKNKKY